MTMSFVAMLERLPAKLLTERLHSGYHRGVIILCAATIEVILQRILAIIRPQLTPCEE